MKKEEVEKQISLTREKLIKLELKHQEIEREELSKGLCSLYPFMIVNGRVERTPRVFKIEFEHGLPILIDDYGMGSVGWSLIEKKEDAARRQLMDNVIWAVRRLPWAVENAPDEVPGLQEVILTGGKSRLSSDWTKLPGNI